MRGRCRPAESSRLHRAELVDAQRPQVDLPHAATSLFLQPVQHGRIGDRLEPGQRASAEQSHGFVLPGPPHDRRLGRTRIGGGEFQGRRAEIIAGAEPDRDPAQRFAVRRPQLPDRIPCPLQRGERLVRGARIGVLAGGRDEELDRRGGRVPSENDKREHQQSGHDTILQGSAFFSRSNILSLSITPYLPAVNQPTECICRICVGRRNAGDGQSKGIDPAQVVVVSYFHGTFPQQTQARQPRQRHLEIRQRCAASSSPTNTRASSCPSSSSAAWSAC